MEKKEQCKAVVYRRSTIRKPDEFVKYTQGQCSRPVRGPWPNMPQSGPYDLCWQHWEIADDHHAEDPWFVRRVDG